MVPSEKPPCSVCGQRHGECLICESICFADDSVERALFVGFSAALGVQLRTGKSPHEAVQFMLKKLCEEHRRLWDAVSSRTISRVRVGSS